MGVEEVISYFPAILAAGAAYGGVRAGLNGARQSIVQIEKIVTRLDEKVDDHGERITVLEVETRNLKEDRKT
jgi:hypothetical protein|tara:strand:- start:2917 stop:3132 length:216 start_codon:yes stop_codon:yes gene_type:complete